MRKRARGLMNELETSLRPLIRGSSFVKKRKGRGKDNEEVEKTSDEREIQRKRYT